MRPSRGRVEAQYGVDERGKDLELGTRREREAGAGSGPYLYFDFSHFSTGT